MTAKSSLLPLPHLLVIDVSPSSTAEPPILLRLELGLGTAIVYHGETIKTFENNIPVI